MIGQILEYNTVVTKAEFLFMIQSVNLPPSAHTITFSAHCSHVQPCTAMYSYLQSTFSAHCSQLQPSTTIYICNQYFQCPLQLLAAITFNAHCSYTIQCTLQIYHPVHTAAIPSSAHCSYNIWCQYNTVHPVHL